MSIFFKYTWKSLKKNRSRTIMTIVGIVLAVSLVTAIIVGGESGLHYFRKAETERAGAYHGFLHYVNSEDIAKVGSLDEIVGYTKWQLVGIAEIESQNEYKPYVCVQSIDDNFLDYVSIQLTAGRMPENDSEIILPMHLENDGGVLLGVGDELELALGERYIGGSKIEYDSDFEEGEKLKGNTQKTYKVVGRYTRVDMSVEGHSSPCYTVITKGADIASDNNYGMFFTVKDPSKFFDFIRQNDIYEHYFSSHNELLAMYFSIRDGGVAVMFYTFEIILILIVAIGVVALIYNAFSISISERTRQFGILKSVGATRKQLRSMVFSEAVILTAIAIPIGLIVGIIGIGTTLYFLRDAFDVMLSYGTSVEFGTHMGVVVNPLPLIAASIICFIIVMISAYIPARRAMKVSAMEAIRRTRDVKISPRKVRTSGLTKLLFGVSGYLGSKNFKRSKKSYRQAVISLVLSIFLFIVSTSFIDSYKQNVLAGFDLKADAEVGYYWGRIDEIIDRDIIQRGGSYDESEESAYRKITDIIKSTEGVEKSVFVGFDYMELKVPKKYIADLELPIGYDDSNFADFNGMVYYVEDAYFDELCVENGFDPTKFYDKEKLNALCYDNYEITILEDVPEGDRASKKVFRGSLFGEKALPIKAKVFGWYSPDGYVHLRSPQKGVYAYYPEREYDELREQYGEDYIELEKHLDKSLVVRITEDEMTKNVEILGLLKERPMFMPEDVSVVLPLSALDRSYLISDDSVNFSTFISAKNHKVVYEKIKQELKSLFLDYTSLSDMRGEVEVVKVAILVNNVFLYGFLVLISLISMTNVFSTISTNVYLRRREYAMLRSVGMTRKQMRSMANYECYIYGLKALLWGLPLSLIASYAIYRAGMASEFGGFSIPWRGIGIASASVFLTVYFSMLYARKKISGNIVDELKSELL